MFEREDHNPGGHQASGGVWWPHGLQCTGGLIRETAPAPSEPYRCGYDGVVEPGECVDGIDIGTAFDCSVAGG